MIKLESIPISIPGNEIYKGAIKTFRDPSIGISKFISVTTDEVPKMVGKYVGFVELFIKAISHPVILFHCIIHQEVLKKIVNIIVARPFHQPEFSALLHEVDSTYSGLLMLDG